jgi:2-keto-4-pentenoate hydratase/2-oxohepta-3-ene-1,7-dioic acid hydratase in catechol pathway
MKLASFSVSGRASYGVVADGGLVDVGARLGARYPNLRAALAADALGEIARAAGTKPDLALEEATLLPPIPTPDKIVCIGLNYRAHAAEAGLKVPEHPSLFLRLTNTLVPHGGALVRPSVSSDMDYEGELAVVIGRGAIRKNKPGRSNSNRRYAPPLCPTFPALC